MVWLSAMVAPVEGTQVQIILSSARQRCHVVDVGLVGVDQVGDGGELLKLQRHATKSSCHASLILESSFNCGIKSTRKAPVNGVCHAVST